MHVETLTEDLDSQIPFLLAATDFCRRGMHGAGPQDMVTAMKAIHEGLVDLRPWLGARIGLHGVDAALRKMLDPASPVRTIVDPRSSDRR